MKSWKSIFPHPWFTDSSIFYRYYSSALQDTFSVVHNWYLGTTPYEILEVSCKRSIGFTKVSNSGIGWVGQGPYSNNVLKTAVITSVQADGSSTIPMEFTLFQNYPNPFNPLTTISFETPRQSKVTIRIYDMLGRQVDAIFDDDVQPGMHFVLWNASVLSSGVYLCVMQTNGVSESIRLLLLK
jgi:hypothetical protein